MFFLFISSAAMMVMQTNAAQQQRFKVTPHDSTVLEGSEAVLRCEVANLAGQVQWTKDGFALGKKKKTTKYILLFFSCNLFLFVRVLACILRQK